MHHRCAVSSFNELSVLCCVMRARSACPQSAEVSFPSPLECEEGTHGENCAQTCSCANGGRCDAVARRCVCVCPPGWTGELCQSADFTSALSPHGSLVIVSLFFYTYRNFVVICRLSVVTEQFPSSAKQKRSYSSGNIKLDGSKHLVPLASVN